jgi:hypothetical protein
LFRESVTIPVAQQQPLAVDQPVDVTESVTQCQSIEVDEPDTERKPVTLPELVSVT